METRPTKYWIISASKDHVKNGLRKGIAQANHGKDTQLKRMKKGDYVLYYSSKMKLTKQDKCQEFTGIGILPDDEIFQVQVTDNFIPWRRKLVIIETKDISILPLINDLNFIPNKQKWGFPFRFGFFEIEKSDFELIFTKMTT
jgi:predicted RNA-binding protein